MVGKGSTYPLSAAAIFSFASLSQYGVATEDDEEEEDEEGVVVEGFVVVDVEGIGAVVELPFWQEEKRNAEANKGRRRCFFLIGNESFPNPVILIGCLLTGKTGREFLFALEGCKSNG